MTFSNFLRACSLMIVAASMCPALFAQGPAPDAPSPALEPASAVVATAPAVREHKFWDRQNRLLFVAVTALNGADFAVTRDNLASGGRELNPLVRVFGRSTPGLAANFAGETAGVIGLSYFFHKTGHHKLERVVALVNIGSSAGAVTFDLTHR